MRGLFFIILAFLLSNSLPVALEEQTSPIVFYHENFETPELKLLVEENNFDEYCLKGSTELEQMMMLKDWVFKNVPFNHNYPMSDIKNSLTLLKLAQEGEGFHCVHFATVYMQCALSMGWTARYLFVRNIKKEMHATNEIWSNELKKWIMIDVTWNIHIEKNGIPLSLLEIREEWQKNGGRDLIYVFGAGDREVSYNHDNLPVERDDNKAWRLWPMDDIFMTYTWELAFIGRNDFFSSGDGNGSSLWDIIYIFKDELNKQDKSWEFWYREDIDDERALYYDINRVDLEYEIIDYNTAAIMLDAFGPYNYTPNFQYFFIKVNNSAWMTVDNNFLINLDKDKTTLMVRIINKFGVMGPVYLFEITR